MNIKELISKKASILFFMSLGVLWGTNYGKTTIQSLNGINKGDINSLIDLTVSIDSYFIFLVIAIIGMLVIGGIEQSKKNIVALLTFPSLFVFTNPLLSFSFFLIWDYGTNIFDNKIASGGHRKIISFLGVFFLYILENYHVNFFSGEIKNVLAEVGAFLFLVTMLRPITASSIDLSSKSILVNIFSFHIVSKFSFFTNWNNLFYFVLITLIFLVILEIKKIIENDSLQNILRSLFNMYGLSLIVVFFDRDRYAAQMFFCSMIVFWWLYVVLEKGLVKAHREKIIFHWCKKVNRLKFKHLVTLSATTAIFLLIFSTPTPFVKNYFLSVAVKALENKMFILLALVIVFLIVTGTIMAISLIRHISFEESKKESDFFENREEIREMITHLASIFFLGISVLFLWSTTSFEQTESLFFFNDVIFYLMLVGGGGLGFFIYQELDSIWKKRLITSIDKKRQQISLLENKEKIWRISIEKYFYIVLEKVQGWYLKGIEHGDDLIGYCKYFLANLKNDSLANYFLGALILTDLMVLVLFF